MLLLVTGFGIGTAFSQGSEPEFCQAPMTPQEALEEIDLNQFGGLFLTAEGRLRVLVVYVRFRDDTAPHDNWPAGSPPPQMAEIIDPNMSTASTNFDNLTHYFRKMSFELYEMVGEAIYVETPHDKSYYGTYPDNWRLATEDVLVNAVDPLIDFRQYDNWKRVSNYNHLNEPDGVVDMIIMVWRGHVLTTSWTGYAHLGGGSVLTLDGVQIKRGYWGEGSGVTAQFPSNRSEDYNFKTMVHELGHWLISGTHPYGSGRHHSFWGILTHGFDGICANAFERERVAWINTVVITSGVNVNLADYLTNGVAYKYHPY